MSRPAGHRPIRALILEVLGELDGRDQYLTAAQIKRDARLRHANLRTISSLLCKLSKQGKILRVKGVGPRGGYGYRRVSNIYDMHVRMAEKIAQEIDKRILEDLFADTAV